ncbi:hypothetical protein BH10ACT2_BH10ACT2_24940 [soil metagenome]
MALFSGCSDSKTTLPATVAPADTTAPVTEPPTTPPPTTIEQTTVAPTTSVAALPFLRSDGLGSFEFGASYEDALAGIPLVVVNNDGKSFPVDNGDGSFTTSDGLEGFGYPSARQVCWADGGGGAQLCAWFGGADPTTLGLVGWDYAYTTFGLVGVLFSASGASTGMLVSDVPAIPAVEGDCYGYTSVSLDGLRVDLQTGDSTPFGTYDDLGNYTLSVPAPAARLGIIVAGDEPIFLGDEGEGDC